MIRVFYAEFGGLAVVMGDGLLKLLELSGMADPLGIDDVTNGLVLALHVARFGHLLLDALNGGRQRLIFLLLCSISIQCWLICSSPSSVW